MVRRSLEAFHAQALEAKGEHKQAVALLRSALTRYGSTSIRPRLQKNINLIALVGQPAPPLQETKYLGPKPPPLAALKSKPGPKQRLVPA